MRWVKAIDTDPIIGDYYYCKIFDNWGGERKVIVEWGEHKNGDFKYYDWDLEEVDDIREDTQVIECLDESQSGEGDAVDGWISVENELPEDRSGWSNSADVNICLEGGFVSTGSYSYLLKKWYDYIYNGRLKITHWQPLPKPPIK